MAKKQKELLLKDLCARLPYGVVVHIHDINVDDYDRQLIPEDIDFIQLSKRNCKPYLRPMSSMTEEEARDYANCGNIIAFSPQKDYLIPNPNSTDWLNKKMFDYRGLIPMDLAIEITEENNPYKN